MTAMYFVLKHSIKVGGKEVRVVVLKLDSTDFLVDIIQNLDSSFIVFSAENLSTPPSDYDNLHHIQIFPDNPNLSEYKTGVIEDYFMADEYINPRRV